MGSFIIKERGFNGGMTTFDVIDGQQRLTTIVLFMKALYLSIGRNDLFNRDYMTESIVSGRNPILVPNHNDRATYMQLIDAETLERNPINDTLMAQAFAYFANRICNSIY